MEIIPQNQQIQTFLENLYDRYKIPLLGLIHKYIGYSGEYEDIFHEVFIRIIRNAEMLCRLPQPKVEAYIFLIARGVSIDHLRKTHTSAQVDVADDFVLNLLEKRNSFKTSSFDPLKRVDLALMMENLPAEERVLLMGKYYLGLSTDELVEIVGGTPTGIRSKIHRARKRVFGEWTKSGLNIEDFIDE